MKRLAVFQNLGETIKNKGNDPAMVAQLDQVRAAREHITDQHDAVRREQLNTQKEAGKMALMPGDAMHVSRIAVQAVAEAPVEIPVHHQTLGQH